MSYKVIPIPLKKRFLRVNCYLVEQEDGYILIDTGLNKNRKQMEIFLNSRNIGVGDIKLIIITHGDFDHIGNCAYLKKKYCCQVAMHKDDEVMATEGNMFYNRRKPMFLIRMLASMMFRFGSDDRFSPDIYLKENDDFIEYGFNAKAVSIPGHSKGSIGILTEKGDLFCGDLLENFKKPSLSMILDDKVNAKKSLDKLKELDVGNVYPGHGNYFEMSNLS